MKGESLPDRGFHFAVSHDGMTGEWWHPTERPIREGWNDCTKMDDEEFTEFVTNLQRKK